jgi:hypothetical protein
MRDALARYDSSAIRGEIIQVVESLRVHERVHSETVSSLLRLVCGILWHGRVDDESFTSAFKTVIHLSNHDPMGQTGASSDYETSIRAVRGPRAGDLFSQSRRCVRWTRMRRCASRVPAQTLSLSARAMQSSDITRTKYRAWLMELVSQSLQLWASVFVFARDRGAEDFCLTSLAVFLAIAVDVTSPADTTSVAIDTETGVLASQLLVTLAAAHAQPFREVVGQLSDESKSRLQRLLNFNKPTGPATVAPCRRLSNRLVCNKISPPHSIIVTIRIVQLISIDQFVAAFFKHS